MTWLNPDRLMIGWINAGCNKLPLNAALLPSIGGGDPRANVAARDARFDFVMSVLVALFRRFWTLVGVGKTLLSAVVFYRQR